jgi:hypothetical protein
MKSNNEGNCLGIIKHFISKDTDKGDVLCYWRISPTFSNFFLIGIMSCFGLYI